MTFPRAATAYWLDVFPPARRELRRWRERAAAIPDPVLRRAALFTHDTKGRHAEGLAAFAVLAPRPHRAPAIRALVAFELILDYLDTITEQPDLDDSLRLHRAFDVALDLELDGAGEDYYALHPHGEDGGYLAAQVAACRAALVDLPAYTAARDLLRRAARLSRQAQSLNHALPHGLDEAEPSAWARAAAAEVGLAEDDDLPWWEMIAAGCSSLTVGALIATAADPAATPAQAAAVEAAYFPWVAGLSTMLDALIDLDEDGEGENHVRRYPSLDRAAERLAHLAARSRQLTAAPSQPRLHQLIVAASGGYYLAQPQAWLPGRAPVARGVLDALGPHARPALAVHCARQRTPHPALNAIPPLKWLPTPG